MLVVPSASGMYQNQPCWNQKIVMFPSSLPGWQNDTCSENPWQPGRVRKGDERNQNGRRVRNEDLAPGPQTVIPLLP